MVIALYGMLGFVLVSYVAYQVQSASECRQQGMHWIWRSSTCAHPSEVSE
ncbi:hypothetical protein GTQ99_00445 [Kineococcus sp. T13]|nr:hypothetical protein [Kineococcus vitellinus]